MSRSISDAFAEFIGRKKAAVAAAAKSVQEKKMQVQISTATPKKVNSGFISTSLQKSKEVQRNIALDIPLRRAHGIEYLHITPEIAQHWLTFNTSNREITAKKVAQFQTDMERGTWRDDGSPIRFSPGKLLDGQHRLMALTLSGIKLYLPVVYGLDPEVQSTMDTGRSRTARDIVSIEGLTSWEARTVGNGIHGLIAASQGKLPCVMEAYTNQEVRNFFLEHRGKIDRSIKFITALPRKGPLIPHGVSFTLHYLFSEKSPEQADLFFNGACFGLGLNKTSPLFHFNRLLHNGPKEGANFSKFAMFVFAITTWNALRRGAQWNAKSSLHNDLNKGEFPEIK